MTIRSIDTILLDIPYEIGGPETGHDARVAAFIGKKFHRFTRYPKAICSSAR